jgi:hypothetical protein
MVLEMSPTVLLMLPIVRTTTSLSIQARGNASSIATLAIFDVLLDGPFAKVRMSKAWLLG